MDAKQETMVDIFDKAQSFTRAREAQEMGVYPYGTHIIKKILKEVYWQKRIYGSMK